eukprot:TRINITY_DN2059_c0_g4_i1.p1 TRINITY_DN2059_c0_g4~~TRINITY_DN2059_c0_g4_i1.p1  ORF type:complete len:559 (+),score=199.99 TRINITY_DN2059_c0_g4_i1:58-1677(+)
MRAAALAILNAALCGAVTYTTNAGAPVDDARNSQTLTRGGPILLQDALLIERLQVHNRERIPERNVHARGATSKGTFTLTQDWSNTTSAKVFHGVGKKTPIACRWSTVIHGKDSPEFLRDPRGFALKLYTEEGNYDIVGLNFPVFFIRDGIRFPEMIRALKPNPLRGVQEWWRIWDYFSNYPESLHMFTWLMDDAGIPANFRQLPGWGIHTFKWINDAGKTTLVRYVYKSWQFNKYLMDEEAVMKPFSFATVDLYDTIHSGNSTKCSKTNYQDTCAGWTFYVQLLDPSDEKMMSQLTFDPLDTTKQWPEDLIPLREVGEFVFDQNPASQFLENEMAAFSPARMVPGIEPSDEKMLQTRLFAYADTQRYRLGVNNQMLPINAPKCPFYDQHVDGMMHYTQRDQSVKEVNYFPSTQEPVVQEAPKRPHDPEVDNGTKIREMIALTDDFEQPGKRYRSFPADRQDRLAHRLGVALSSSRTGAKVRDIWLGWWEKVDADLAAKIRMYVTYHSDLDAVRAKDAALHSRLLRFRDAFLRASGSSL